MRYPEAGRRQQVWESGSLVGKPLDSRVETSCGCQRPHRPPKETSQRGPTNTQTCANTLQTCHAKSEDIVMTYRGGYVVCYFDIEISDARYRDITVTTVYNQVHYFC